ncbi:AAA family ATPase [Sphingobacterium arenae]|uniref:AAA family ATPase n=1 Tax=Sphingobacterium arenae TaxID=1280598 RepID=A0ABR7Y4K1_9SPHI|nr:AAA family ATPase [Sphingobacterium arenae]MBD1426207.1 AAA family ATPase [Sphingobacterium arenae]
MGTNNFYIITGGPGVGKTTLINELRRIGCITVEEEARRVIKDQLTIGGDGIPWRNKALYAQLMFDASVRTFEKIKNKKFTDPVYFDRGILDTICYMNMENIPVSEETREVIHKSVYNSNVFILPPWREIYQTDSERKQSWKEALFTFDKMKETYLSYGYNVIEVPKTSVLERQQFVVEKTKNCL